MLLISHKHPNPPLGLHRQTTKKCAHDSFHFQAEKQAEEEENARQEELKSNPMKLLEERTEASKNEMARMEALEELQELNKREVKVNYEGMLQKYDRLREEEAARQEQEDEAFVKSIFGRNGDDESVKRLNDDEDDDSDEEEKDRRKRAKVTVEKPTDFLSGVDNKEMTREGVIVASLSMSVLAILLSPRATAKCKAVWPV